MCGNGGLNARPFCSTASEHKPVHVTTPPWPLQDPTGRRLRHEEHKSVASSGARRRPHTVCSGEGPNATPTTRYHACHPGASGR